jgi:hypothetical protein
MGQPNHRPAADSPPGRAKIHHAMLYRVLQAREPRPANVVRIRVPVRKWADVQRPKAGYRCLNKACSVSVVLIEVDSTTLLHLRAPHLMREARCPFCRKLLRLVSYYEIVELATVEER